MAYVKLEEVLNIIREINHNLAGLIQHIEEHCPTANVVEVKHGEWKTIPMFDEPDCDYISFECSCCGNLEVCEENYCSECGAKMDGGTDR